MFDVPSSATGGGKGSGNKGETLPSGGIGSPARARAVFAKDERRIAEDEVANRCAGEDCDRLRRKYLAVSWRSRRERSGPVLVLAPADDTGLDRIAPGPGSWCRDLRRAREGSFTGVRSMLVADRQRHRRGTARFPSNGAAGRVDRAGVMELDDVREADDACGRGAVRDRCVLAATELAGLSGSPAGDGAVAEEAQKPSLRSDHSRRAS